MMLTWEKMQKGPGLFRFGNTPVKLLENSQGQEKNEKEKTRGVIRGLQYL